MTDFKKALHRLPTQNQNNEPKQWPIQVPELMSNVVPAGSVSAIAMDYNPCVYDYAQAMCVGGAYQGFPGYPYLAGLSTRAEYRQFAQTMATELTREWIKIKSTEEDGKETNPRITQLTKALEDFKVRKIMAEAAMFECFYGRGQILIDIKGHENETPLILDKRTIAQGSLNRICNVEAFFTTPSMYNSLDPAAPDFYQPREWFMLGKKVHASRLLTVVTRPLPAFLRPAFNFGGMSLSQLAEPYVENWLRTRQSVADLINNFSITVLATDMAQMLTACDDGSSVTARADFFTKFRANKGLMMVNKETEELVQVNTPLSGLHELQSQSQEHLCSVSRIPAMILTGISPSGLNASSEGEIRAFYDWVKAQQTAYWHTPLDTIIKVIMLHLWGEIDEDITFEFNSLWQISPTEEADNRNKDMQTNTGYINAGVVSPEEVREQLAQNPCSGFNGLDIDTLPEMNYGEENGEGNPFQSGSGSEVSKETEEPDRGDVK